MLSQPLRCTSQDRRAVPRCVMMISRSLDALSSLPDFIIIMSTSNIEREELVIESPGQLVEVFGKLLGVAAPTNCNVEIEPLSEAAILSCVYQVTVSVSDNDVPSRWIAKFLKDTLLLEQMFQVEGTFYKTQAAQLCKELDSPIHIPKALYCGPKCIVLEYVPDTISFSLLEGCPPERLELVLSSLARIHAHFWNRPPISGLSSTAGIGSAMSGLEKEQTFPSLWKTFVDEVALNPVEKQKLGALCTDLSKRTLQDIHKQVHEYQPTLIHGDFHVGNLLFHNDSKLTILDWATCGEGNNMVDVVFFLVVSTNLNSTEIMSTWLPFYHRVLLESNTTIDFSWEMCVSHFRTCLLNQFLVLVCYDEISKQLLASHVESKDLVEHYTIHFENVNRRCAEALLSEEMNVLEYRLPPFKTASTTSADDRPERRDDIIRQL